MARMLRMAATVAVLALALAGCHPKTPPPASPAASAAERLAAAKAALAQDDCDRAWPDLAEAVRLQPGLAEAQLLRGICAFKRHDAATGREALSRAMAADPASPRPYEALGVALYGLDRRDEARKALDTAVAKGSTNPRTFYYLGNLAMFAGDCRSAFADYRRATVLDADFRPAAIEFEAARRACAHGVAPRPAGTAASAR